MILSRDVKITIRQLQGVYFFCGSTAAVAMTGFVAISLAIMNASPFPWDQAHYAGESIRIVLASPQGIDGIYEAVHSAVGFKPPLLTWLGSLFVPLTPLVGAQLPFQLLSALLAMSLVVTTVWSSLRLGVSRWLGPSVAASTGCSLLILGLGSTFFVELLQAAIVAASAGLVGSVLARRQPLTSFFWKLLALISLGLLTKTTTVVIQALLVAALVTILFFRKSLGSTSEFCSTSSRVDAPKASRAWIVLAIAVSSLAVWWYARNWQATLNHAVGASFGSTADLYGEKEPFPTKLRFWWSTVVRSWWGDATPSSVSLAFTIVLLGIFIIAVLVAVSPGQRNALSWRYLENFLVLAAPVVLYWGILSQSVNSDIRFALPAVILLVLMAGTSMTFLLSNIANRKYRFSLTKITLIVVLVILGSLPLLRLSELSLFGFRSSQLSPLIVNPTKTEYDLFNRLNNAVAESCDHDQSGRILAVGVEWPSYNANSATFISASQALGDGNLCLYTSLGYAEVDEARALARLEELQIERVIFPRQFRDSPELPDAFNQVSHSVFERLHANPNWIMKITQDGETLMFVQRR